MTLKKSILLIIIILLIDQISKIYIKTNFILGESYAVFDWFKIYFIENDGMAWGTKFSDFASFISERTGKVALTLFRIVAIFGIGYWLYDAVKKQSATVLILAITFVFAGALGNIIDSTFYGVLFDDSYHQVATFLPEGGGYDNLLHGRVVDMLYFPIWKGYLPEWLPLYGGKYFTFFEPVFNVADMAISTGFIMLLVFNKKAFSKD
ncbi:lipoprotein signal peptidase [Oceanihabitans sediminis]|uniref:Lipoprotein signal peptidase n=1 Tax=Oceanihabitans sediminis TaxID=1812012 RepID=A0A368P6H8_9FLAO|nr:lipoprotein signal peptidase [Oceanihabitans sediminis]MDX1278042.1 lipoprotein signal peptidase [Oceanihabitans sediminis]MDX1773151.1 lipoprotein signal peptidase [Oceanihabitans sediminis]RBP34843.1 signal peptidase II [Oceanihabitans sediminis]RCU58487.1 lipoprotein signal peptidase [Oceanihabitans sediminis]